MEHTIAFMGVPGANADLACRQSEPYMDSLPCASFEDVFQAVKDGKAQLGMLPIENSQAGRVAEIHQILPHSGLHIVGEFFLHVSHSLVAAPGVKLETITDVYSHPQALLQCRENLRKMNLTAHVHSNTAVAARDIKEWNDPTKAALCSPLAAELYGLQVMKEHMEDVSTNTTVFVKVARQPLDIPESEGNLLTSVLFTLRNIPAGLYKALGGFATNGVNMIKLESYMHDTLAATAQFFVTFSGHPSQQAVKNALEELQFFTESYTLLGTYPAAPERSRRS